MKNEQEENYNYLIKTVFWLDNILLKIQIKAPRVSYIKGTEVHIYIKQEEKFIIMRYNYKPYLKIALGIGNNNLRKYTTNKQYKRLINNELAKSVFDNTYLRWIVNPSH